MWLIVGVRCPASFDNARAWPRSAARLAKFEAIDPMDEAAGEEFRKGIVYEQPCPVVLDRGMRVHAHEFVARPGPFAAVSDGAEAPQPLIDLSKVDCGPVFLADPDSER